MKADGGELAPADCRSSQTGEQFVRFRRRRAREGQVRPLARQPRSRTSRRGCHRERPALLHGPPDRAGCSGRVAANDTDHRISIGRDREGRCVDVYGRLSARIVSYGIQHSYRAPRERKSLPPIPSPLHDGPATESSVWHFKQSRDRANTSDTRSSIGLQISNRAIPVGRISEIRSGEPDGFGNPSYDFGQAIQLQRQPSFWGERGQPCWAILARQFPLLSGPYETPNFLLVLDCSAVAWFRGPGPVGTGPQIMPNETGLSQPGSPPPPPMPSPPGQPVYPPSTTSFQPAGVVSAPPAQSTWPPAGQPAMQPTAPYVPSDQSVYPGPGTTPYVPSDQTAYPPPGPYAVAPAQPVYPEPLVGGARPWSGADTGRCESALGHKR